MMPIRNAIWTVSGKPQPLIEGRLPSERMLEDMIVAAPRILSDDWMLIGRQERTGSAGVIDLLAIAPDGALVLIELKRERTPREVVAQAIDYAVWVEDLEAQDIAAIYRRVKPDRSLRILPLRPICRNQDRSPAFRPQTGMGENHPGDGVFAVPAIPDQP